MTALENPLGLDGFEFVEFCAPEKGLLEPAFERMGFSRIAHHRSKDVDLWRQGAGPDPCVVLQAAERAASSGFPAAPARMP